MDCIIYLTGFIILLNLENYMTVHEFHLNDLQFLKEENQNFKFEQELVTTAGQKIVAFFNAIISFVLILCCIWAALMALYMMIGVAFLNILWE